MSAFWLLALLLQMLLLLGLCLSLLLCFWPSSGVAQPPGGGDLLLRCWLLLLEVQLGLAHKHRKAGKSTEAGKINTRTEKQEKQEQQRRSEKQRKARQAQEDKSRLCFKQM